MRYHFKHVKMAVTKRTSDNCQGGYGKKGTSVNYWWEYTLVQPLCFPVWQFKELIGFLSIYPKEIKSVSQKDKNKNKNQSLGLH